MTATPGSSTARRRWIGNAPWCDISIVWARDVADNQVKGFIVENKTTPGFSVEKIENKIALKVVQNGQITLTDCRVPDANRLQGGKGRSAIPRWCCAAPAMASAGKSPVPRWAPTKMRSNTPRSACSSASRSARSSSSRSCSRRCWPTSWPANPCWPARCSWKPRAS